MIQYLQKRDQFNKFGGPGKDLSLDSPDTGSLILDSYWKLGELLVALKQGARMGEWENENGKMWDMGMGGGENFLFDTVI